MQNETPGLWDGSAGKEAWCQAWHPAFHSREPHGRKKAASICALTSTGMCGTSTSVDMHINKVQNEKNAQLCSQASKVVCIRINMYGFFKSNSQNVHSNLCMVKLKRNTYLLSYHSCILQVLYSEHVRTPLKFESTYLKVHAMTFKINWQGK